MTSAPKKKLVEVALPLEAINIASAREKSIRHGHPSTLHLWWARRPLAAARAVIFAQMVDDPSGYVNELKSDPKLRRKAETILKAKHKLWEEARDLTEKAKGSGLPVPEPGPEPTLDDILADNERQRLFRIIEDLVLWENTTNETVLNRARAEIKRSWARCCLGTRASRPLSDNDIDAMLSAGKMPALPGFHDPFAGGGALPLEAQRLGLESYASDLNPVAVLINKAMIEIPPKFAGKPPVNPESRKKYLGARASCPPLGTRASCPQQTIENQTAGGTPAIPGWHSRGYLPHFDQPGMVQSITFRLADSVPADVIEHWRDELQLMGDEAADDPRCAELRERIEKYADQGKGACWLKDPAIGEIVETALLHFDTQRYRLLSWCVMPNHVHALIETQDGHPLGNIVQSWKSYTAKECNRQLGRKGELWMPDYFDRYVRDANHFHKAMEYIVNNPVKAGLCEKPEGWKWSSAGNEVLETLGNLGTRASCPQEGGNEHNAGGTPAFPGFWKGAQGLAEDVRYYGQWMRDEAEKHIGHLYPKIEVTAAMAKERPDLKQYVGKKLTVIAWLWARTVKSPNPAFSKVDVPLVSTFMLSTKAGKETYVEPVILGTRASCPLEREDAKDAGGTPAVPGYTFTVKVGKPNDTEGAKSGTKLARANFACLMSGSPISGDYIKAEGKAKRMGARLMAIVAEGDRGRVYLAPTPEHEAAAQKAKPTWRPEGEIATRMTGGNCTPYGLTSWGDLFTPRQLVALTTFSDLVQEARERVKRDYLGTRASCPQDPREARSGRPCVQDDIPLADGGIGATAYADAVAVYLGMSVSRQANRSATLNFWDTKGENVQQVFGRQALPMTWDFVEGNPLSGSTGNFLGQVGYLTRVIDSTVPAKPIGIVQQGDAQSQSITANKLVSTDPPYYDNIGYADLSDFFYVWLRRSLKPVYPDLFGTLAVPKAEELVATPYRHGSKEKAETFFLDGMTQAMHRLAEQAHPAFPVTIYYAFKQAENVETRASSPQEDAGKMPALPGVASTGWDTFLAAVIEAGFAISGTWPMRTEYTGNLKKNISSLASSIVLVCRQRAANAPTATRREFVSTLKAELPVALAHLQRGNIAPVDLAQAAIGPGMAVYTRYSKVLDAEGKALTVREALALINQTLDEALAEQEGDFDPDSRWALTWFEQAGFEEGEYGVAEQLSKSKNTSVAGMVEAGILESKRGKVRLLRPEELPADWDPASDRRLTAWEFLHQLIRVLGSGGEAAAAELLKKAGETPALPGEIARELCYRLYTLCERKKRADDALAYNGLVQSWPEILRLARAGKTPDIQQPDLIDKE